MSSAHEQSLIIVKPDAIQRNLLGEIITRFEKKGLKIIGLKMKHVEDIQWEEHYGHLKDKPFFAELKRFMSSAPVVLMAVEGVNAISAIRIIVGATMAFEADAGSIRGDYALGIESNVVHASDSVENGKIEIERFFEQKEIVEYKKIDEEFVFAGM